MDTIISKFSSEAYDILLGYKSTLVDSIMARASAELKLPLIPQIVSINLAPSEMMIKQSIFSGKALSNLKIGYASVLQLNPSFAYKPLHESLMKVESVKLTLPNSTSFSVSTINKVPQGANLGDANYVVGAGRGLKDPSNWGMIEELAAKLGAATACSKPVSDINWRPHSEHVGQTGIKIAPKLYIACGISGAIQHLAGVNGSKTIVVINNDPEAPFFKYADYGIVGDVFDVIPEIVKNL
jgi:electron transfer flavoprotein alpha subunit